MGITNANPSGSGQQAKLILRAQTGLAIKGNGSIYQSGWTNQLQVGMPFQVTTKITSAAAATAVTLIPDACVPSGMKVYITNIYGKVNGSTLWATTATVTVQDTASSPVQAAQFAVANMTSQALIAFGATGMTVSTPISIGSGLTAGKGVQMIGDVNGTGSDFYVTITGYIQ